MSSETTRTVIRHWFSTFDPACACPANFEGGICDGRGCCKVKQERCSLGYWHDLGIVEWFYSSAPISADKAEIIKEMACTLKFQSAQEVAKKSSGDGA